MSETTTAPAPAAEAPAAPLPEGVRPPAALTDSPLSASEAARRLAQHKQELRGQPQVQAPPAAQQQPRSGPAAADQMAEALGLRPEHMEQQQQPGELPQPSEHVPGFEVDGRRYSPQELRAAIGQATDYTRKTQALAEQQRSLQAQQEALASVVPYLQPELERLQQQINGAPMPPQELAATDPAAYLRQLAAYQHAQAEQQRLGQLQAMNAQAMNAAMQRQVEQSNQILAQKLPGWGNPETRGKWQSEIVEWATNPEVGYTRDELRGLVDSRHLLTMMKAYQWDKMLAGAKTVAPVPRIQTAPVRGLPPPPAAAASVANAQAAFDARPSIRNAAAVLTARRPLNGGSR